MWLFLKNLKLDSPDYPALSLLDTYIKDITGSHRDPYTSVVVSALFTIAGKQKQPSYPSSDSWIMKTKIGHIYEIG